MGIYEEQLKTLIRVFRRECHRVVDSERTTIHGADSMLRVLQLAAAEVSKQERGEFAVALCDVLVAWKCLLLDKLRIPGSTPRVENYDLICKEYDCFLKRTNTVDLIDVYNLYKELKKDEDPEEPMTTVQLFEFLLDNVEDFQEAELIPKSPATPSNRVRDSSSQEQGVVRRLICSYLGLLVNFKNDLAFADILSTSNPSLGHTAFTDLKHAARKTCTSLFLTATSFVRAIQLGGKGYAPAKSDPLRKHIKCFSQFVHFTDQLEELLGDTSDPSVVGARMLDSIRAAILKGRSNVDPVYIIVEDAVQDLKERIKDIHTIQKEPAFLTGISPARPRVYAINHATAYAGRETVKVLLTLLDEEALVPPCRNKAQLLADDRAVLNGTEGVRLLTLYKSPEAPMELSPKPVQNHVQSQKENAKCKVKVIRSQFACTYADDGLPLKRVLNFPSTSQLPTCVHPTPKHLNPTPVNVPPEEEHEPVDNYKKIRVEVDPEVVALDCCNSGHRVVLGQRCSNSHTQTGVPGNRLAQTEKGNKTLKRKLSNDCCPNQGTNENHPPQKRPPTKICNPGRGKNSGNVSTKKLIAGQGKLTSFFRL